MNKEIHKNHIQWHLLLYIEYKIRYKDIKDYSYYLQVQNQIHILNIFYQYHQIIYNLELNSKKEYKH